MHTRIPLHRQSTNHATLISIDEFESNNSGERRTNTERVLYFLARNREYDDAHLVRATDRDYRDD